MRPWRSAVGAMPESMMATPTLDALSVSAMPSVPRTFCASARLLTV
jgi:hypothetical protein